VKEVSKHRQRRLQQHYLACRQAAIRSEASCSVSKMHQILSNCASFICDRRIPPCLDFLTHHASPIAEVDVASLILIALQDGISICWQDQLSKALLL
jgi:hypothetical protein